MLRLRTGRLDRVFALASGAAAVLWLASLASPAVAGLSLAAISVAAAVGALWAALHVARAVRWLLRKLLWRVRHRMVAVFFFVGFLPIALGALIVACGLLLLFGPLAAHTVSTELRRQAASVAAAADPLLWQLGDSPAADRLTLARRYHGRASQAFPGLVLDVRMPGLAVTIPADGWPGGPPVADLPAGQILLRHGQTVMLAACAREPSGTGRVLAGVPLTSQTLAAVLPGLGVHAADEWRDEFEELPPPAHALDRVIRWPILAQFTDWTTGEAGQSTLMLQTRPSVLWEKLLAQETDLTAGLLAIFGLALVTVFALNVLISFFVAWSITRTLTRAVNDLYVGTQHVNRGDFSYRIPTWGSDQVSDLSRSFNAMTASVERLLEDSKRRQQLEAELEIAREVQAQLFPARAPAVGDIEILGVCRPASTVSGDFFDYVAPRDGLLAISFGDVSGKGISAALVMASLHSALRAHLALLAGATAGTLERRLGEIVRRANAHLFESTAANKFATLLFAAYEADSGTLAYSNAGHLPPLLVRAGNLRTLEVTGMIVGAFPEARFGTGRLALEPGDTLVAYTDGLTEPESPSGEEFGEERLRAAVSQRATQPLAGLIEGVMGEVLQWSDSMALQDDMTMLVIRRRPCA